jgi:hypothetical protein
MGRKQTCQPVQLLVQATNRHSDLMLKSQPFLWSNIAPHFTYKYIIDM